MKHLMRRARVVAVLFATWALTAAPAAQPIYESTPTVVTATIEVVEQATRVVTLKTAAGSRLHVTVPPDMEGFDRLRVGDLVTARYFEAIAIRLARPGSPAPSGKPTTIVTQKDGRPGSETRSERTLRVTVTAVDVPGQALTVKGLDGSERTMKVTDVAQLQTLKVGDALDVTFYESRLVNIERR